MFYPPVTNLLLPQVMAYFTVCMWLVPFSFFVSLSANENVLPTLSESRPLLSRENDVVSNYFSNKQKGVGLLSVFNSVKDTLTPGKGQFKSYWLEINAILILITTVFVISCTLAVIIIMYLKIVLNSLAIRYLFVIKFKYEKCIFISS